jgi:hypothetical protein
MPLKYITPLLLLLFSCSKQEKYLGGIQVNEPDYQVWADALKRNNMNTVSVTVYAKQGNWDSDNFWHDGLNRGVLNEIKTAKKNNLKVVLILRTALDHAFKKNKFLWHGMISPKNESTLEDWFTKYEGFIGFWARIAQQEDVDVLGIGSELKALSATQVLSKTDFLKQYSNFTSWQKKHKKLLLTHESEISKKHLWVRGYDNFNSLSDFLEQKTAANLHWAKLVYDTSNTNSYSNYVKRTKSLHQHWTNLIQNTRKLYKGKITYAANFDNYDQVAFWNDLDFIGINAYFKLRRNITEKLDNKALAKIITASWDTIFHDFEQFKDTNNFTSPLLFTELGYTYRENSTVEPWAHDEFSVVEWKDTNQLVVWYEQPKNYQERNIAIKSMIEVNVKYDHLLHGVLYWKLSTDLSHEQYEEFLLHIGKDSKDPLLSTLQEF